jgi:hypothetical protein
VDALGFVNLMTSAYPKLTCKYGQEVSEFPHVSTSVAFGAFCESFEQQRHLGDFIWFSIITNRECATLQRNCQQF